jgi:3-hydroxyacyl-[acyl-carrier-protein] dehydratase
MDIHEILQYLPHRYPFLLVDRVLSCEPGKNIEAVKNVSGVLIIEALAQAAAILSFKTMDKKPDDKSVYYFVGIDGARFKKPVFAGDQLHLHVEITRMMKSIWKYQAQAKVDGQVVSEAELMCTLRTL